MTDSDLNALCLQIGGSYEEICPGRALTASSLKAPVGPPGSAAPKARSAAQVTPEAADEDTIDETFLLLGKSPPPWLTYGAVGLGLYYLLK